MTASPVATSKQALRREMLQKRKARAVLWTEVEGEALAGRILQCCEALDPERQAVIAAYLPIMGEMDVQPALAKLAESGWPLCLPVVEQPESPLIFRSWQPGDRLVPGPHGTHMPEASAGPVSPGILLVPLLAFDRSGVRLGMGGGYYDRTLQQLRAAGQVHAIGIAYAMQEVEALPVEANDQRLDGVVTEENGWSPGSEA